MEINSFPVDEEIKKRETSFLPVFNILAKFYLPITIIIIFLIPFRSDIIKNQNPRGGDYNHPYPMILFTYFRDKN